MSLLDSWTGPENQPRSFDSVSYCCQYCNCYYVYLDYQYPKYYYYYYHPKYQTKYYYRWYYSY